MNKNYIKKTFKKIKKYVIDSLSFMALGLFSSLIISLIIKQFSLIPFLSFLNENININNSVVNFYNIISSGYVCGAAIGVSIAYGLKKDPLVIFSSCAAGAVGYLLGGPLGSYISTIFSIEIGKFVSKKTIIDIVVTPFTVIMLAIIISYITGPSINSIMSLISEFIEKSTNKEPFIMGLLISVVMGMALTSPLSSAAICIMLQINGLAAGAAAIGCCTQMVGFAIMSYKDNKVNGVLSVGIGTSMLQFSNIVKKPITWLPTIIASAILGPIATLVFKLENTSIGAGMGTSGLVGLFGAYEAMNGSGILFILKLVTYHVIIPGVLVFIIYYIFLKLNLIKDGDLKINTLEKVNENKKIEAA